MQQCLAVSDTSHCHQSSMASQETHARQRQDSTSVALKGGKRELTHIAFPHSHLCSPGSYTGEVE